MIRSFDYASQSVLLSRMTGIILKEELPVFEEWAGFWSSWVSALYLAAYLKAVGNAAFATQSAEEIRTLLDVFLLERAVCELANELNLRPARAQASLRGILRILESRG
jgi:maltose alpha-D-glucosyltransferase/alpha-amylase